MIFVQVFKLFIYRFSLLLLSGNDPRDGVNPSTLTQVTACT
ncbi:hypothetical protein XBJ2_920004 [Xenorhabdus bovienii str. Jollieti]|nr:hypothetical protein XBJ2_920004 [Xenorhabdus bovienii str. Jollieti]